MGWSLCHRHCRVNSAGFHPSEGSKKTQRMGIYPLPQDPCMLYMVTFTINIPPMLAYIPYMDPMGPVNIQKTNWEITIFFVGKHVDKHGNLGMVYGIILPTLNWDIGDSLPITMENHHFS